MDSIIPFEQKNTLDEYMILSGAENHPPMLDKDLYDSWKSRMELYMQNKEHERMILESVENGNQYHSSRSSADIYSLVNYHRVAKDLWDRVQLLMQGDDLIACLNKAVAFLTAVASSRFPLSNNQLRTSSNLRNQATIKDGRVIVQQVQRRQDAMTVKVKDIWLGNALSLSDQGMHHVLMANISNYGFDVISEVPHSETYLNDMKNQGVHAMQDFEQPPVMDFTDNEIHNDSNIISCSQYLQQTQQENVQDTNLQAQQDSMILYIALKEQVDSIKQNLSKQIKERECLLQTLTTFKRESKEKEDKNIENEIDLEKKLKELENIIFKVGQSAQTVHMLTKPQVFYDNIHKQALGYQNPFYLKKAQRIKPTLYDGIVISAKHVAMPVIDDEETLILKEERMLKLDLVLLAPKLLQNKEDHIDYLKYTQEQADILWGIVEQAKAKYPLDNALDFACKHAQRIQELLVYVLDTYPDAINLSAKKISITPKNKVKKVRFAEPLTSSSNIKQLNANSELICATCNKSMFDGAQDMCLLDFVKNVNIRAKSAGHVFTEVGFKWKPTGKTFSLVGNSCPLTRITSANIVPPKKTTSHSVETQKTELKVYSRKPKNVKNIGSSKKAKIVESKNANHSEPNHTWGSKATDIPSSSSFIMTGTIRFRNDHISRIMGYGDHQLGNVTISRVYYVEGLGHNLFSVSQFCDADLEVAFQKITCFLRNLEGVDLISGSRDTNLYTISLDDMRKTSLICLLSKASKTKSCLWYHRLSNLNFSTLNKPAKDDLARGIPRLKFQKDHMYSACALEKSNKSSQQLKVKDTNQEKLHLLHMDLCGPMHVASINRKRYILVIVDDYSRFT
nr:ribonuclease H-like domain-containing protein [Tanacetum cinerariifolium]